MKLNEIKLTNKMIDIALKDAIPSANMRFHEEKVPFKKVFISKHASERFEERFGAGFTNFEIARKIASSFKNGYYSLTFKDIPSFAVDVNFGEVTALVQMSKKISIFDQKEEIYLVKTVYLKMNEYFIEKMEKMHDEKIKDSIFEKMIRDQFFKGKTEQEIFKAIKRPSEKIVNKVRKAINESYKMVDPIKEMESNVSLFEETEAKEQYKFGDGVKTKPVRKEKIVYINKGEYDPLDDLLDSSLFDVDEVDSKFKFGDDKDEEFETSDRRKKSSKETPLGLDLDSNDFPW